jgi:Pectate lyase superfamily protein
MRGSMLRMSRGSRVFMARVDLMQLSSGTIQRLTSTVGRVAVQCLLAALTLALVACPKVEPGQNPPPSVAQPPTPPPATPPPATPPPATQPPATPLPALPPASSALTPGPIAFPDGFMKSVKDYGAKGDGTSDDTAAITAALGDGRDTDQDYSGKPKALYFPAGTYLVSNTVQWRGCCVTLQGQGSSSSVIRLKDSAAGFGSSTNPKPVIQTIAGNMAFNQNIWDLAVNTGSGNAGAIGIDYISSNIGSLRNIAIISADGAGARGLDMTRQWPGPLLVKNLLVRGFNVGIDVRHAEYGPTLENIYLENQREAGILNDGNTLAIHALSSKNSVPAIKNTASYGSVILLSATLEGGLGSVSAIENSGQLYARNVSSGGYGSAIKGVSGSSVSEYVSGAVKSLFASNPPAKSLGLPILETPTFSDASLSNWGKFTATYYGDTDGLQALLNSGKSTIYFPSNIYFSYAERAVVVPPSVKRIVGFGGAVNRGDGANGGGIRFIVQDDSSEPLIVEQFKYGIKVEQRGKRPIALKYGSYEYVSQAGAGDLFLEDVGMEPLTVRSGQRVWARQLNNEYGGLKMKNDGGQLWILGLKTERAGTVIETVGGGSTELLGTLIYPATGVPSSDVAFKSVDSKISLIYSVSAYIPGGDYAVQVQETRGGVTKQLLQSDVNGRMPLFVGF